MENLDSVINYFNDEIKEDANISKDSIPEVISKFNALPNTEKEKFNINKLNEIKNEQLKIELFCFVKASNLMSVYSEKSKLAKGLLKLNQSNNENDLNKKCKNVFNPMSCVLLFYYASNSREYINNDSKKIDDACQSVSAKNFYSIEFIKILFNTNEFKEFYFIKEPLKTKLLREMSPNSNIAYENLNKPTVNIFENIWQRNSSGNDLSAWLVWVYAKFNYYDQTVKNFALISEELRWQALSLLLEINQSNLNNVNITIDHINLLPERDRKEALENEIIRNELIKSIRNNWIGRGFGIGLMIVDAATVVGLIVGGVFAITNLFVWAGAGCALIIGAIAIGVTSYNHRKINSVLNPPKPKSQKKEPLLNDVNIDKSNGEGRKSVMKKVEQVKEGTQNQQEEKPNNLEGQGNNEQIFLTTNNSI